MRTSLSEWGTVASFVSPQSDELGLILVRGLALAAMPRESVPPLDEGST